MAGRQYLQRLHYGIDVTSSKMETKNPEAIPQRVVQERMRILSFLCLTLVAVAKASADPVAEMASFSVFDKVDLAELAKGEPKVAHGPPMGGRYISAQSCFVVPGVPARVSEALRQWNPARHSELKVLIHSDLPGSPTAANFSRLSSAPDNGAVRSLVSATQKLAPDLQISKGEEKKFAAVANATGGAMPAPIAAAWADVLSVRARAGRSAQPPYDHTGQAVRPSEELNGLLRQQEKIRGKFSGVLDGKGEQFWELLTADEQGVLTLGASYRRSGANGTFQAADALYYASGGYYAGLTLYQMWPVEAGGRPATLVWRGDFISSATIAGLHGIERVAAESAMMRDISKAVSSFRRDIGSGR
ncbi:MAG: hypothetical protein DLM73_15470 [Chthoniobacterales bacterium]|nr:MAG: hypothetical protein DLM73_15470 [Chthoniobacterales bacterium]